MNKSSFQIKERTVSVSQSFGLLHPIKIVALHWRIKCCELDSFVKGTTQTQKLTQCPISFSIQMRKAKRDVATLCGLCFPWPKVTGSLNHKMKGEFRWDAEQSKCNTHIPLLLQLDTINIDCWEEEGGACSSGRGDLAKGTASAPLQNI
jgi:hypothetical protein